jgi:transposase-like protein
MTFEGPPAARRESRTATIPAVCPACQSSAISTTARTPDDNAYWLCAGCGEVWNASRRKRPREASRQWR